MRRCLEVIEERLDEKSIMQPDLLELAQIAKAVSVIRSKPAPKSKDDMDYEALLEKARQFPELIEALGIGGGPAIEEREAADDE